MSSKIQRKTVGDLTLDMLREKILMGEYREGQALRQDALAAELGVSRIPVREALRQLESEGLVTFTPHLGATVSSLSLPEITELFELRALIETSLLPRAMQRIREDDLQLAEEIMDVYQAAFAAGDVATWGALNWKFHSTLLAPSERPLTLGVLENLHNQSDRYARLQLSLTHGEDRAVEEHRAILEAVRAGDEEQACALLREHVVGAGNSLLVFLRAERGADSE